MARSLKNSFRPRVWDLEDRVVPAFALSNNSLIPFDVAAPASAGTAIAVSGLSAGENLVGIDYRPSNGLLYALTSQNRLMTLNTATGAATLAATLTADPTDATNPFTALVGTNFGVDFNPVVDRLRVVGDTGQNLRINPTNGQVITDSDINPGTPSLTGGAYTNSFAGSTSTTLYGIDSAADRLVIQNPPNNGTLTTVGVTLGVDVANANGFDIRSTNAPTTANTAYLLSQVAGVTKLYTVDLTLGLSTLVGTLGDGTATITGLAVEPPPAAGISVAASAIQETAGFATVTVNRTGDTTGTLSLDYSTANGTATAGADYVATTGTLNFAAGETTKSFTVSIMNDQITEGAETFRVSLTSTTPVVFTTATETIVIRDDETPGAEAFAVTTANSLVQFDPLLPGTTLSSTPITGLNVGEGVVGIDFRPANSKLYALTSTGRLVTINTATATATLVAALAADPADATSPFTALAGTSFGFDFNPTNDFIRIVSDAEENLSVNPNTGLVTTQTALNPGNPEITAAAYTNSFANAGSTTLYTIDTGTDQLFTQNPPGSGTLTAVGSLGLDAASTSGFDIVAFNNQAFAALNTAAATTSNFYTINLTTGKAESLGSFPAGTLIRGLAIRNLTIANNAPTISDVANITGVSGKNIGPIAVTVGDAESTAGSLTLSATSSNPALIPNASIFFAGSGENRTILLVPAAGQFGTSTITLTVTDSDGGTATDTFAVNVTLGPVAGKQFAVGRDAGSTATATLYNQDRTVRFSVNPFGDAFTGGVRVAAADVTGDGINDLVTSSGSGVAGRVRVYDGATQAVLFDFVPFGETFNKGVSVAAGDLNNDGLADLVITAEAGGGARVRVFQSNGTTLTQRSDFIGLVGGDNVADTNYRGGSRATVADINGDGTGDLVFAAGAGGGPRIAIFDGTKLSLNGGPKLTGDFFALDANLRDGAYVAAGDFNGDGKQDLVAAASGSTPRVVIYDGAALLTNTQTKLADFQYPPTTTTTGVRIAVKDLNNDSRADLLVGHAPTAGSKVTAYDLTTIPTTTTPTELFNFDAFAGFTGGVFVG